MILTGSRAAQETAEASDLDAFPVGYAATLTEELFAMYGFVYIWLDRKYKRYYVGCHWGRPDSGHVCNSPWMMGAYQRRPQDFKRRIIQSDIRDRDSLFNAEASWLGLIKDNELGIKYYNIRKHKSGHWTEDPHFAKLIKQKLSARHKGKHFSPATQFKPGDHRSRSTEFKKGRRPHNATSIMTPSGKFDTIASAAKYFKVRSTTIRRKLCNEHETDWMRIT
jgi:hypothetical protein